MFLWCKYNIYHAAEQIAPKRDNKVFTIAIF